MELKAKRVHTEKKVVHYLKDKGVLRGDAGTVLIWPVDHPSNTVSNTTYARTSPVIKHDKKTGRIETQNTIYIPQ